jgi:hypothetical protein
MVKHYIPSRDRDFDEWFAFMNQYVTEKCSGAEPAWTHIPQAVRTQMLNTYSAWYTAYSVTLKPCTSQAKAEKRRVRKTAEQLIRPFVNQFLRCLPVTDADRDNMGIPNHDPIPRGIPVPESQV